MPGEKQHFITPLRVLRLMAGIAGLVLTQAIRRTSALGWALYALGVALVGVTILLSLWNEYRRERRARIAGDLAAEYDERLGVVLGDTVTPIADLLGDLIQAPADKQGESKRQLLQMVVDAAAELCGPNRTRACFFRMEENALVPDAFSGRGDEPKTTFRAGEPRGDQALALVRKRDLILVEDTTDPPNDAVIRPDAPYRTFISAAVVAGTAEFGMLSVDAEEPGSLDLGDVSAVRALAKLLAAGLAVGVH